MRGPRIDCQGVSVTAGFTDLVAGVTVAALPGRVLGLLGPSGAGKSTLLGAMAGIRETSAGSLTYDGRPLTEVYDELRTSIGLVPQDDLVHPSLTPRQELHYAALLRLPPGTADEAVDARVTAVLDLMELGERADTRIRRLSGGQRKRVSMGVELLAEPPVLFLDEPTAGLDPALEGKMMDLFRTLARQGRTVVVTTHVMESLDALDAVAILHGGRLVWFGPPADAPAAFGVTSFAAVYRRLAERSPQEWEAAWRTSGTLGRQSPPSSSPSPPSPPPAEASLDAELEALKREMGR